LLQRYCGRDLFFGAMRSAARDVGRPAVKKGGPRVALGPTLFAEVAHARHLNKLVARTWNCGARRLSFGRPPR